MAFHIFSDYENIQLWNVHGIRTAHFSNQPVDAMYNIPHNEIFVCLTSFMFGVLSFRYFQIMKTSRFDMYMEFWPFIFQISLLMGCITFPITKSLFDSHFLRLECDLDFWLLFLLKDRLINIFHKKKPHTLKIYIWNFRLSIFRNVKTWHL